MKRIIEESSCNSSTMLAAFSNPAFIISTCHALGHVWRERKLGPVATIHGFLLQILHGNTACTAVPLIAWRGGVRGGIRPGSKPAPDRASTATARETLLETQRLRERRREVAGPSGLGHRWIELLDG